MTNETLPRPSNWLLVVSVLNIGVNLWLVSETFATYVIYSYSFLFWFGVIVGPFSLAFSIQQYRGTFRRVPSAAKMCSVVLFVIGSLICLTLPPSIFFVAITVIAGDFFPLLLFIPMPVTVLFLFGAGHLNAKWKDEITAVLASQVTTPNQRGYSLRELFLLVAIVAAMSAVVAHRLQPEYVGFPWQAEHVDLDAVPFVLPASATNISYSQGYQGKLV